jgi:hypothetical protein
MLKKMLYNRKDYQKNFMKFLSLVYANVAASACGPVCLAYADANCFSLSTVPSTIDSSHFIDINSIESKANSSSDEVDSEVEIP